MKRKPLRLVRMKICSVGTIFVLVGLFSGLVREAGAQTTVRVSYPQVTIALLPIYVGMEKGFYKKEGLEVDYVFTRGFPGVQSVMAGDSHFATNCAAPMGAIKGGDIRVVLGAEDSPYMPLYSKKSITTLKALKGKTVATSGIGSVTDTLFRLSAQAKGFKPSDFKIITIGGSGARLTALKAGTIDAGMLANEAGLQGEAMGFHMLLDTGTLNPVPAQCISTRLSLIKKNPGIVEKFVRATKTAAEFARDNRAEAIAIAKKSLKKLPAEIINRGYDVMFIGRYNWAKLPEKVMRMSIKLWSDRAGVKKTTNPDEVYDWRFVK